MGKFELVSSLDGKERMDILPWTISNYLRVSKVIYSSRARIYVVKGIGTPNYLYSNIFIIGFDDGNSQRSVDENCQNSVDENCQSSVPLDLAELDVDSQNQEMDVIPASTNCMINSIYPVSDYNYD